MFVDAMYKLKDLHMPLYIFLVEDGNGESEVVAIWMVVVEDTVSISQMAEIFKKHNPSWENTKTIMSDKDFIERDALTSQFPDSSILICLFHVLRTFHREITCDKLGITSAERVLALEKWPMLRRPMNIWFYIRSSRIQSLPVLKTILTPIGTL